MGRAPDYPQINAFVQFSDTAGRYFCEKQMSRKSLTITVLMAILAIPGIGYAQNTTSTNIKKNTVMEKNKSAIYELYDQCINGRNMTLLDNLISEDFPGPRGTHGVQAFQAGVEGLIHAFPDIHYELTSVVAADDKVAVSWQWTGTSTSAFLQYPANGKKITNDGMAIFTFRNGRITAATIQTDRLGFLQAMDVLPTGIGNGPGASDPATTPGGAPLYFIDKFFVPAPAIDEFMERMKKNRTMLKTMSGFVHDDAYSYKDKDGNLICVTIAAWKDHDVIEKAKQAVQAEYKREGFDMPAMLSRLHITIDRGVYSALASASPVPAN